MTYSTCVKSKETTSAFVWSRILGTPFWALFNALPVILYKEFHASPLLITFLIALKPASALLATYWSCFFCNREKFLIPNLIITNLLRFLPFLFVFAIHEPWLLVAAYSLYMTLSRGATPAWMEVFKGNLSGEARSKVVAVGNTIEYVGMTILPLVLGIFLDINSSSWRILFPIAAFLGLISTLFLMRIPPLAEGAFTPPKRELLLPWKRSWELLSKRPDFARYLFGFMLGGAGLMIIQPILPIFFVDSLQLSYTEMLIAISVCKGIGFTLTSQFWASLFGKIHIYLFSTVVVLLAALFPICLFGAKWSIALLYFAFLLYGFMQAGSELSWNLSGVVFSRQGNSLPFTETNILAVGVRGCIVPFIGNLIFYQFNAGTVLGVSALLCLLAALPLRGRARYAVKTIE